MVQEVLDSRLEPTRSMSYMGQRGFQLVLSLQIWTSCPISVPYFRGSALAIIDPVGYQTANVSLIFSMPTSGVPYYCSNFN